MNSEISVTTEYEDILKDEEIELVAECIGGLHPAYEYVSAALKSGKHVVTPNKNLVAAYWDELHDLAREHGAEFRYTASAGGGIPWLFNLQRQSRSDGDFIYKRYRQRHMQLHSGYYA